MMQGFFTMVRWSRFSLGVAKTILLSQEDVKVVIRAENMYLASQQMPEWSLQLSDGLTTQTWARVRVLT